MATVTYVTDDYEYMRISELTAILHGLSLSPSGNKTELINRLREHDNASAQSGQPSQSALPPIKTTIMIWGAGKVAESVVDGLRSLGQNNIV
ncbi:hypothetical protein PFICI_01299 [Pestalotiopsis fici W106-1]|uniref:SAP domain-containing protein n=1 Tax=Pestalotiopsis fici (strain W106-1 / CGMCC3.15140) TaxID=1229662 RepID=W3XQD0_PESFW|nr:uncharacterized protein PFICI_01299 [Pestalotiopsis fici W106-1]ETS87471.1 hypothetical protein PFICI_01299 [Pestalotiopsis fici W106-1]